MRVVVILYLVINLLFILTKAQIFNRHHTQWIHTEQTVGQRLPLWMSCIAFSLVPEKVLEVWPWLYPNTMHMLTDQSLVK